jgi:tRNA(Arg) A34 adenosine deaminase TadA
MRIPVDSILVRVDSRSDSRTRQEFQGVNHAETNKLRVVYRGNRSVGCELVSTRERSRSKSIRSETAK